MHLISETVKDTIVVYENPFRSKRLQVAFDRKIELSLFPQK